MKISNSSRLLLCIAIYVLLVEGTEQRPRALGQPRVTKDLLTREWELSWPPKITDVRTRLAKFDRFVPVIGASRQRKYSGTFLEKRRDYGARNLKRLGRGTGLWWWLYSDHRLLEAIYLQFKAWTNPSRNGGRAFGAIFARAYSSTTYCGYTVIHLSSCLILAPIQGWNTELLAFL